LSILGVDLQDSRIWDEGFTVIESWLEMIET
jgi:oligoendopeptidase F